jgi:3-hydroxypropanoate dehydrogenase
MDRIMTITENKLAPEALDLVFRSARTQNGWLDKPVTDAQLQQLYDLLKYGPTSMNTSPARFVFLRTPEAKARLLPALAPGNVEKTTKAPVCVVVGYHRRFHDHLPTLFPHKADAHAIFEGKPELIESTAFRNGSLQGAYLIIAARALGLDCGPMSGFDAKKVNDEFFPEGDVAVNFLCNLGYGDSGKVLGRLPRLSFNDACTLL